MSIKHSGLDELDALFPELEGRGKARAAQPTTRPTSRTAQTAATRQRPCRRGSLTGVGP